MSSQTSRFNLVKPAINEGYDVDVQNGNMDKIEAALSSQTVTITPDSTKISIAQWGALKVRKIADMLIIMGHGVLALSAITAETVVATVSGVSDVPTVSALMRVDGQQNPAIAVFANSTLRFVGVTQTNQAIYFELIVPLV